MLGGEFGAGVALAMRIVARTAGAMSAPALLDVSRAHIDGCLYHGQASLDFVDRFVADGAKVAIPTTLNVGSLDLIHPELFHGDRDVEHAARRLMAAHLELGCESSFTCAPYQLKHRPALGEQIAWAESNAIVFANSVLGARTNRYGDFLDLAAALTGRAPQAGLHVRANRAARVVFEVPAIAACAGGVADGAPSALGALDRRRGGADSRECYSGSRDVYFAALGMIVGQETGTRVPALVGLPSDTSEDELKALGAAAASAGAVALFHAVGITPEAPTLDAALHGGPAERTVTVSAGQLRAVRQTLNSARAGDALVAVSLGTPHFSMAEFERLAELCAHGDGPFKCDFYVNTSRYILWQLEEAGLARLLTARGVQIVVDTCTYITPVMKQLSGLVMTNSAKWAHYAPANIGVRAAFGSMHECVRSAFAGEVRFDE